MMSQEQKELLIWKNGSWNEIMELQVHGVFQLEGSVETVSFNTSLYRQETCGTELKNSRSGNQES